MPNKCELSLESFFHLNDIYKISLCMDIIDVVLKFHLLTRWTNVTFLVLIAAL